MKAKKVPKPIPKKVKAAKKSEPKIALRSYVVQYKTASGVGATPTLGAVKAASDVEALELARDHAPADWIVVSVTAEP